MFRNPERKERPSEAQKMRVPVLLWAAVCLCAAPGPGSGAERSCADLRQFYTGKGFTLTGVPQTEISGEFNHTSLHAVWIQPTFKNMHVNLLESLLLQTFPPHQYFII